MRKKLMEETTQIISVNVASKIYGLPESWFRKEYDEGNIEGFRMSPRGKRFLSCDSCRDRIEELKKEREIGQVNDR